MKEKKEYLLFLILFSLKKNMYITKLNIERLEKEIDFARHRVMKCDLIELERQKKIIVSMKEMYQKLFSISSTEQLDTLLYQKADNILPFLAEQNDLYDMGIYNFMENIEFFENNDELLQLYKTLHQLNTIINPIGLPFYADTVRLIKNSCNELIPLYKKIIDFNLYNPNIRCGESKETLWTYLPNPFFYNDLSLVDYNKKIILDHRTNYYLPSNGSDYTRGISVGKKNDNGITLVQKYLVETIIDIIKVGNFSTIDSWRSSKDYYFDQSDLLINIFEIDFDDLLVSQIKDLRNYLLSKEGINKQIISSKYMTPGRNNNIDFYIRLIEEKYGQQIEEVNKLKSLKF